MASINSSTTTAVFFVSQTAPIVTYTYSASSSTIFPVSPSAPTHLQL